MKERGILFSARMVRAILAGQKSQTRRIVKPREGVVTGTNPDGLPIVSSGGGRGFNAVCHEVMDSPYGVVGDRLWVRETWRSWERRCIEENDHPDEEPCSEHCHQVYVAYAATPRTGFRPKPDRALITYLDEHTPLERDRQLLGPWKPAIHMPRAFSHITLEVTRVRVERLQDITEEDARAEGVSDVRAAEPGPPFEGAPHRKLFSWLWDEINEDRAPWSSNPFVWVVEFKRVQP
jgi:hypothetical protein